MTREFLADDEKPLIWVGSSRKDLMAFPEEVRTHLGAALGTAQFGGKHPDAKPWKGEGPGVMEVVEGSIAAIPFERCTRCGLPRRCMCFTHSRRSPRAGSRLRRRIRT